MAFFTKFKDSAAELKSIRCIATVSALIALDIVLKMFSINITKDLKITFAYLALAMIGALYGPTVGFISGAVTDIIGFLMKPDGGFNPLFTLVEAVGAMIYGIFLYKMKPVSLAGRTLRTDKAADAKKPDVLKTVLVSLGIGAVVGALTFAVTKLIASMAESEGLAGKIAAVVNNDGVLWAVTAAGFIYGVLFTVLVMLAGHKGGKNAEVGKTLTMIFSKVTVVVVCNLIMTPAAMILSGYSTLDSTLAGYPLRLFKNAVQCPVDCVLMILLIFPLLAYYRKAEQHFASRKRQET